MSEEQVEQELMQVDQNLRPNHIILITVLNAQCPISVQVISKLTRPIGRVLRIVVFKRGTVVQSMVEFDNIQTATAAKNKLHGCDIYRRSCTLKVEFAKTDRLDVRRNDDMAWDYTDEFVGMSAACSNFVGPTGWDQHYRQSGPINFGMDEEMDVWRNGRLERWRNVTREHQGNSWW